MDALRGDEFSPGKDVVTDAQILGWIRNNSQTGYHAMGTPHVPIADRFRETFSATIRVRFRLGDRRCNTKRFPAPT